MKWPQKNEYPVTGLTASIRGLGELHRPDEFALRQKQMKTLRLLTNYKNHRLTLTLTACLLSLGTGTGTGAGAPAALVSLVNPMQGTDSTPGFSHGNEYPAICLPFPMNTWAPYTQPERDAFYYQYRQPKIRGIRQTHQPSPWIADYAVFSLMPVSGKLAVKEDERASDFSHAEEVAQPSYYRVRLDTWKATAEVTPTERYNNLAARLPPHD